MNRIALLLNADDLNQSEETNNGIFLALKSKVVRSATTLVSYPLLYSTLHIMGSFPQVSFGLHFNLTRGEPIAPAVDVPSLVNINGKFDHKLLLSRLQNRRVTAHEVQTELLCQIKRFQYLFEKNPTHIDSHHYIHSYSPIREVLFDYCRDNGYKMRRPEAPNGPTFKTQALCPQMPDAILFHFRRSEISKSDWKNTVEMLKPGVTEIPCHVRYEDNPSTRYFADRNKELNTLISFDSTKLIKMKGIRLMSFVELAY